VNSYRDCKSKTIFPDGKMVKYIVKIPARVKMPGGSNGNGEAVCQM